MKISMTLLSLSLLFISIHCSQQDKQLSADVLSQLDKAEKEMIDALSKGDSIAFKNIAGYDYVDINATGTQKTLQAMLDEIPDFKGLAVGFSDQLQRVYGNFVLRTGKARLSAGQQLVAEVFYTQGWYYRNNKWQFVHWQGTMTKDFLQRDTLKK